jgi:hypothetical protein
MRCLTSSEWTSCHLLWQKTHFYYLSLPLPCHHFSSIVTYGASHILRARTVIREQPWISCRGVNQLYSPLELIAHSFPLGKALKFILSGSILILFLYDIKNHDIVTIGRRLRYRPVPTQLALTTAVSPTPYVAVKATRALHINYRKRAPTTF